MMETGFDRDKHFCTGHNSYHSQYPYKGRNLSLYTIILNEVFYNDLVEMTKSCYPITQFFVKVNL